jgi:Flp pilus assembly protein TadB
MPAGGTSWRNVAHFQEAEMSEFVTREKLVQVAAVVSNPASPEAAQPTIRDAIDRGFELPTGLYLATVTLYLGFIAVMATAFAASSLALPLTIIAFVILAAFAVPTLWVRMEPKNRQQALTLGSFRHQGIQTASGPLDAGAAIVQVLILPMMVLGWGLAVAIIAALT